MKKAVFLSMVVTVFLSPSFASAQGQQGPYKLHVFDVPVRGDFNNDGILENQYARIFFKSQPNFERTGTGNVTVYPPGTGQKTNCNGTKYEYMEVDIKDGWHAITQGNLSWEEKVPDFPGIKVDVSHVERYYDWKYAGYEKLSGVDFSMNCHGFAFGVGNWPKNARDILDPGPFPAGSPKTPCYLPANKKDADFASDPEVHTIKVGRAECEVPVDPNAPVPSQEPPTIIALVESVEKYRESGIYRQTSDCPDFVNLQKAEGHEKLKFQFFKKR